MTSHDPGKSARQIEVTVISQHPSAPVDESLLAAAVRSVLSGEGVHRATINVAVIDDAEIQRLNRQFLAHDHATDVLSFLMEAGDDGMEGEIAVSAETATRQAARFGWQSADELLLYVIHGALHLAGFEDGTPQERAEMRGREAHWLRHFGVEHREDRLALTSNGGA
jgi:probable rRNA maturation factor